MILNSLSIFHYRNIDELSFDCNESLNCLVGKNGVGKTNVLDAIYYLSFCKSNVLANDALNIKHGEPSFIIQGAYDIDDSLVKVSCAYEQANKQKVVKCIDKKYTRFRLCASMTIWLRRSSAQCATTGVRLQTCSSTWPHRPIECSSW